MILTLSVLDLESLTVFPILSTQTFIIFFINTPSPYTKDELKAYKSLDGYKYLVAGWVGDVYIV